MSLPRKILPLAALLLAAIFFAAPARADDSAAQGFTAVIDIDNRSVSLQVNDLPSCLRAITERINNLKMLYQNNLTVTDVVGECFDHKGQLAASGRCGVKIASGQITRLCIPEMH